VSDNAVSTPRFDGPTGSKVSIVVVSASAGAGHDAAARAWAERLESAGFAVLYRDFLDALPRRIGHRMSRDYLGVLARCPWLYGVLFRLCTRRAVAAIITRLLLGRLRRRVGRMIDPGAVAVLSTYPLASQVLGQLRASGQLQVPVVTFLTDFSVHHLWVSTQVDQHLALHETTAAAARRLGAREVRVTGPVVPHRFVADGLLDRRQARVAIGLPAEGCLALLVGGSWGVGEIEAAAGDIAATGVVTPVVLCGHNDRLRQRLQARGVGLVLGWISDMPTLLRAVDVVVENAGGMTSLEAMATGVPVLTYRAIPGHGRANARALHTAGVSSWARDKESLARQLSALTKDALGEQQRARARAVFARDPLAELEQALRDPADRLVDRLGDDGGAGHGGPGLRLRWRRLGVAAGAAAALLLGHSFMMATLAELLR
jgi:UDP-N-acetylglucosamine:LPS N-acetylglucosamine transferase